MQTKSPNEPRRIAPSHGQISRRTFFKHSAKVTLAATVMTPGLVSGQISTTPKRKMTICLTPGSIGVSASQMEAIALAERHRFEAVEPFSGYLASAAEPLFSDVLAALKAKNLVWGAAGLSVDYRKDEKRFNEGMKR